MPMKKAVPILTLLMLLIFTVSTSLVMAQDKEAPNRPAPAAQNFSPEEMEAFSALMHEHHMKMAPIRDQMWGKRMEYNALSRNPNGSPEKISALVGEMVKLRGQLRDERAKFFNQAKEKGLKPEMWKAHMGGHGRGFFERFDCDFNSDHRAFGMDNRPGKGSGDCCGSAKERGHGHGKHRNAGHHNGMGQ